MTCVNTPSADASRIPINDAARTYLDAVNVFLTREGEQPIDVASVTDLPSQFPTQIAQALEVTSLRRDGSPFLYGDDVKPRVNSRERNQHEADLMRATAAYYRAAHPESFVAGGHYKIWKRKKGSATELEEVSRIDPAEHAIIGFNGLRGGMEGNPKYSLGFIDQIEQLLGKQSLDKNAAFLTPVDGKPIGIYVVTHPDHDLIHYAAEIPASNANPETYVSDMTRELMNRVILPSVGLDDSVKTITLPDAKRALRQLNVMTFSQGSVVSRQMRNVLAETLMHKGLRPDEVKTALAQVYALSINPTCRLDETHPCGTFSNIYQVSKNDHIAAARADYARYVPAGAKPPHLVAIGDHELMVWEDTPISLVAKAPAASKAATYDAQAGVATIYSVQAADLLPHAAGYSRYPHALKLSTEGYAYTDADQGQTVTKFHDPSHLDFSLRNAVKADELPDDLTETFTPTRLTPPPDPALASPLPPKLSEVMKQAIRNFRDGLKEKIRS